MTDTTTPTPQSSSMAESINRFLEDQHPLVRSNIKLGAAMVGFMILLHLVVFIGVRVVDTRLVFEFNNLLNLFQTLVMLLIIMMAVNAARTLWLALQNQGVFTLQAAILAIVGVILVAGSLFFVPNVFARKVAYDVGRPYGEIYGDFRDICERWEVEWADAEAVVLNPADEDLGRIGEEAHVTKVRNTVFFDFGDAQQSYGFACALRGEHPLDTGVANQYTYKKLTDAQYQFIESTEN